LYFSRTFHHALLIASTSFATWSESLACGIISKFGSCVSVCQKAKEVDNNIIKIVNSFFVIL
jgi:hypothetical protein